MKILLACEESQTVCKEFRRKGHEAYSCDEQECSGGHPEWHIQDDVLRHLDGWDMIIGFPPCTHLSCACADRWEEKQADGRQQKAFEFVLEIWNACDTVCIENPQGWLNTNWCGPNQVVHPYYFGDPYLKRTCLWLKNLKLLRHFEHDSLFEEKTHVTPEAYWVSSSRTEINAKKFNRKIMDRGDRKFRHIQRSKFHPGIARAMADQWG